MFNLLSYSGYHSFDLFRAAEAGEAVSGFSVFEKDDRGYFAYAVSVGQFLFIVHIHSADADDSDVVLADIVKNG